MISSCRARWEAVLRLESTDVVGEVGTTRTGAGGPLLCRGRTGVMGSGRLRVFAELGDRLSGLGMDGPVVVSFMERRCEKDCEESEGVRLCGLVVRGAILPDAPLSFSLSLSRSLALCGGVILLIDERGLRCRGSKSMETVRVAWDVWYRTWG